MRWMFSLGVTIFLLSSFVAPCDEDVSATHHTEQTSHEEQGDCSEMCLCTCCIILISIEHSPSENTEEQDSKINHLYDSRTLSPRDFYAYILEPPQGRS